MFSLPCWIYAMNIQHSKEKVYLKKWPVNVDKMGLVSCMYLTRIIFTVGQM